MNDIRSIPNEKGSRDTDVWIVLLKDLGDYALYFNKTNNCFAGFEVHKIRIREAQERDIKQKDGSIYHMSAPKRRVIAGNEDFGRFAWHYPNINLVYEKYPEFKKYDKEIKSTLNIALKSVLKPISRDNEIKTTNVSSKPSISKSNSDVIAKKGESIVLCKHCNYPNRIVRAFFWSGCNKGKIKPLSDMLCPNCGHFMGHNVIDGLSVKNRECLLIQYPKRAHNNRRA